MQIQYLTYVLQFTVEVISCCVVSLKKWFLQDFNVMMEKGPSNKFLIHKPSLQYVSQKYFTVARIIYDNGKPQNP
jgi:hypothetical protein